MQIAFIIPIHNQAHFLQRCVESIYLRTPPTEFSIVLVDDGSTDVGVEKFCRRLVHHSSHMQNVTYLRNDTPMGFSRACNQGMAVHTDCSHYAIINTDTEIGTPDWTRSLRVLSHDCPDIGLFGPVSNNATTQSVPTHRGSGLPKGETVPSFTKLVTTLTQRRFPPMALIHGFCYIVRKSVIDNVGNFDEDTFPHYGSEDDLSLRAAREGWQGAVLDDTFVYHAGMASYTSTRRNALVGSAVRVLMDKYGEGYVSMLSMRGSMGLEYMRVAMAEYYNGVYGMPRRVQ